MVLPTVYRGLSQPILGHQRGTCKLPGEFLNYSRAPAAARETRTEADERIHKVGGDWDWANLLFLEIPPTGRKASGNICEISFTGPLLRKMRRVLDRLKNNLQPFFEKNSPPRNQTFVISCWFVWRNNSYFTQKISNSVIDLMRCNCNNSDSDSNYLTIHCIPLL